MTMRQGGDTIKLACLDPAGTTTTDEQRVLELNDKHKMGRDRTPAETAEFVEILKRLGRYPDEDSP